MPHDIRPITDAQLADALALRDLTDPAAGEHCMQRLVAAATQALAARWNCPVLTRRGAPVVDVADNYDRLGYPPDGPARDARYTRYLDSTRVLRTHTSAAIPAALRELAVAPPDDVLVCVPGLVWRRDSSDRLHVGEPHQLDLWRVTRTAMSEADLHEMISTVVGALLPGVPRRATPSVHPYTVSGLQVDVRVGDEWVELLECGLAHPRVLAAAGLPAHSGLAMGIGLDRAVMLRKHVPDIRLLRDGDPRVAAQMLDLRPYHAVSAQPVARRDMSVACAAGTGAEELGDRVRDALAPGELEWVESVSVLSRTPAGRLPAAARERMGIAGDQENLLVSVLLRHPTRSLPKAEANRLRDRIYVAIHEGTAHEWAAASAAARICAHACRALLDRGSG